MTIYSYFRFHRLPQWLTNQNFLRNHSQTLSKAVALITLLMLWGCSQQRLGLNSVTWKTYENHRYGFEFPYPSNWQVQSEPTNEDGVIILSPQDETVEIRGWAANRLPDSVDVEGKKQSNINPNFQTQQGEKGVLLVEATPQKSSMKLTLITDRINYYWQGKCSQEEFDDYYRLFYYIAQNYRIIKVGNRL